MPDRLVKFFATGCGVGYLPATPGTWGTIVGVAYAWAVSPLPWQWQFAVITAALLAAVWISSAAERILDRHDPQEVVIDEIAAFPLATFFAWNSARWAPLLVVVAFVLFRIADILKPPPANKAQQLPGGWGVVVDDVVAAVYAGAAVGALRWILPGLER